MANQQARVNLSFTADTQQAKQQLLDLKNTLNSLSQFNFTGSNGISAITTETLKAGQAAAQLKLSLESATNVNTGKLNLTKFSQEMDRTGMSFKKYRDALLELGPEGAQAFSQLTDSVLKADSAIGVGSKKLNDFFVTLKNTAKWQISSNIMHGFEGALKSAYGYAQDLNKSLNDIRIVTGYNVDKMAEFAEHANKAAKNLSSTTLDYTDASLIYYQQGLNEQEVQERTDITIKMANAAGQSAQVVSDQMTAVWNNFDNGSKSLEYYADVMTALGAATASSTDEIAAGLEKFAAISDTVGLSYEYATAALATVTDRTRQSAEVVGTAFKAMFARIQGLELGETLEDGTTLNKYSEALASVGVNIKDANGELKNMDIILEEMADVWATLSRDQQVALAQTVAGVRQYNQLVSLMENWDAMEMNLDIAFDSEGALQEQADIYAESWEAASKRVKAASEGIYQDLLDDKSFITILNVFEDILTFIDNAIDGLGGLKGVLTMVLALVTKIFSGSIAKSMDAMSINLQSMTKKGRQKVESRRDEALKATETMNVNRYNEEGDATNAAYQQRAKLQRVLLDNAKNMNEEELSLYQTLLDGNQALADRAIQRAKEVDDAREQVGSQSRNLKGKIGMSLEQAGQSESKSQIFEDIDKEVEAYKNAGVQISKNASLLNQVKAVQDENLKITKLSAKELETQKNRIKQQEKEYKNIASQLKDIAKNSNLGKDSQKHINSLIKSFEEGTVDATTFKDAIKYLNSGIQLSSEESAKAEQAIRKLFEGYDNISNDEIDQFIFSLQDLISKGYSAEQAMSMMTDQAAELAEKMKATSQKTLTLGQTLTTLTNYGSSIQMIGNSLSGIVDSLNNTEMTGFEKVEAIFTSLLSLVPALVMAYESFNKVNQSLIASSLKKSAATMTEKVATEAAAASETVDTVATNANTAATNANTGATNINTKATNANATALRMHPIMGLITIIMGVISALTVVNSIIDANTQKIQQNADAVKEKAQQSRDEANEVKDLSKTYEEALKAYDEGVGSKADLKKATNDLVKAYDDENIKILAQTEQYDKLLDAMKKARLEKLKTAQEETKNSKSAAEKDFINDLRTGDGHVAFGTYQAITTTTQSDIVASSALEKAQDLSHLSFNADTGNLIVEAENNAQDMIAAYEEVLSFIDTLKQENPLETLQKSDTYNYLVDWLDKAKDSYQSFAEESEEILSLEIEIQYEESFGSNSNHTGLEDAQNIEEYKTAREAFVESIAKSQNISLDENGEIDKTTEEWKNLNSQVNDYLFGIKEISDYEAFANWENNLEDMYDEDTVSKIQNFIKTISDEEDLKLIPQIDFDEYQNEEEFRKALEELKSSAEDESVVVKLEVVREAQSIVSPDKEKDTPLTEQDYQDLQDSGIDWGDAEQGIVEFSEFVKMTHAEQVRYLNELEREYSQNAIDAAQQAKQAKVEELETARSTLSNLVEEQKEALSSLQNADSFSEKHRIQLDLDRLEQDIKNAEHQIDDLVDEIEDQDLELAIQLEIEGEEKLQDFFDDLESIKDINDTIRDDVKKTGNSYILTADQAREWANVYPEILANATIAADGSMELNAAEVNDFIAGKEAELIAAGEAEIAKLEMDKAGLEAKSVRAQAELDLVNAAVQAESDTERNYYLWKLEAGNELTGKLIEMGIEEAEAHRLATAAMAGNEEEFSRVAKEVAVDVNGNFSEAAYNSAMSIYRAMNSGAKNVSDFSAACVAAAKSFNAIGTGTEGPIAPSSIAGPTFTGSYGNYEVTSGTFNGTEYSYDRKTMTLDDFVANRQNVMGVIDAAIGDINAKIASIRGNMDKSLNTYTPETARPNDNKNKNKNSSGDNKKDVKDLQEIAERYHEINKEIEYYNHLLNKLGKLSETAHGGKKVKLMKQEQKALEDLYDKQEDLYFLQLAFIETDKQQVQNTFTTEAVFDVNGNLTNYSQLVEEATSRLNAAREAYNNSAQEDADKEALEAAEKKYEEELAVLEQYEETVEAARKQEEELIELAIQLQQKRLDTITYVIDLKIEVNDEELKQLDFLITRLESREFQTATSLQKMQDYFPIYQSQANTAKDGMDRTLGEWLTPEEVEKFYAGQYSDIDWDSKTLPPDFWDKIYEYADNYKEATEAAIQLRTEVYDKLGEAFADLTGEIDKTIEKFDHYSSVMDHYTNIIDLSGAKNQFSTEELKTYNQLKVTNANEKLESSLSRKESYKTYAADREGEYQKDLKVREDLIAQINSTTDEATKKQLEAQLEVVEGQIKNSKKAWEEAEDAAINANEEYLTAWEEALQTSRDVFLANAQLELDALEEQMAGAYGSLEAMQEEFDRNSEINDRYLEDYERIYELTKLNRDLTKKMDETSNIKAKKELAKLQEEILFYQEEGRKMSDYDLEYLQKKYDLRVAELALEEAQNAKTQVRLTRDSEGNYSYTYTADEDSLAEAQQTYEDKLYEITNLSNEHIKEQTQALLSTQQEYIDSLAEIHQKAAEGQYKTTEEYQQALDSCTAYYVGKMNYHGGEVDKATLNNEIVYKRDYSNYSTYVGEKISESTRLKNQMEADILESEKTTQYLTLERQAARDAVHLAFANGLIEDEKAYKKSLSDIDKSYEVELAESEQRTLDLIDDRNDKYALDFGNYDRETDNKLAAEEGFITSLQDTWLPKFAATQSTGADFVKENFTKPIVGEDGQSGYLGQVKKDFDKMNENIATNMTAAGVKLDEAGGWVDGFKDKVDEDLITGEDSVTAGIEETSSKVNTLIDDLVGENGLTKTASGIHTWATDITTDLTNMITEYDNLAKAVGAAKTAMAEEAEDELDEEEEEKCSICGKLLKDCKGHNNPPSGDNGGEKCPKCGKKKCECSKFDKLTSKKQLGVAYSVWSGHWGNGEDRKTLVEKKLGKGSYKKIQDIVNQKDVANKAKTNAWVVDVYGKNSKKTIADLKKDFGPSAFFTGGYTGAWGSNGKLAILHEKELVLNKEDTSNMLKIISMVRDLSSILDLQAHQSSLAQSTAATLGSISNYQDAFEQTVTIHAEFPDAVYAAEIETALNNLVNSASQFANRKY